MRPRSPNRIATIVLATLFPLQWTPVKAQSVNDEYRLAEQSLEAHEYPIAEARFRAFLLNHPNDREVAKVFLGLGESLMAQNKYRNAAETYLRLEQSYRGMHYGIIAAVRLAEALVAMQKIEAACSTFNHALSFGKERLGPLYAVIMSEKQSAKCP